MSKSLEDILKSRFSRYDRFDVMRWLTRGHKTINRAEQMSLLSLIAYASVETDTPIDDVQNTFLDSFGISHIESLRSDDYDDAVHALMHWKEKKLSSQTDKVAAG